MISSEYDATWLKAVAFINRALDDIDEFEERAFWAACSLKCWPTPQLSQTLSVRFTVRPRPKLARPDNVFRRCQSITSRFDAVWATGVEASRNRYLDSGEAFCSSFLPA
jgi:hypothetical protein